MARARSLPLIDVRSPTEFRRGAARELGAVSQPLLDDGERAEVGTLYKQVGRVEATQRGLEMFSAKAARFLDDVAAIAPAGEVGVHCWRGGMRSRLTGLWLEAAGFRPIIIRGGYKAYRHNVLNAIAAFAAHPLLVLDGRTGSGKSALLRQLAGTLPLVDFEGLACHRGSAFGDFAQAAPVPTQQDFEAALAERFLALGPAPRILVEIETLIGPLRLPPDLCDAVHRAPVVLLERDFDDRVERLAAEYAAGWDEREDALFVERCTMLKRHVAAVDLQRIIAATRARDFRTATRLLLQLRYDKVYDKGIARRAASVVARFNLTHEEPAAIAFIAGHLKT